MRTVFISATVFVLILQSCGPRNDIRDASGSFEADDVIVSAQFGGQLLSFNVMEGDSIPAGKVVGTIDSVRVVLQREQVKAGIRSLSERTTDVSQQVKLLERQLQVQQSRLNNLLNEEQRLERLVEADAATGKQLDDMRAQVDVAKKEMDVTRQQIAVQKTNNSTMNRSVLSERLPMQKQVKQLDEELSKASIVNPVSGIVLTRYALPGEVTAPGKALYRIADVSEMILRAYITGSQLSQVKINQPVKVFADSGPRQYRTYPGTIIWISDRAEFTPKTIQTREERANLVYAVKIRVKNDGFLKIGMFGEVDLQNQ
jgi:HlyD family secretion protein